MRAFCLLLPILFLADGGLAASGPVRQPKLEGMPYDKARAVILSYGWTPVVHRCEQVDPAVCAAYPEVEICQMLSPGTCIMEFSKGNRCLAIDTLEAPPGTSRDDTWVTDVTFYDSPCPTDQASVR